MNRHIIGYLAVATTIGIVAATGCRRASESNSSESTGEAERTGTALDRAAERTVEGAQKTGEAVKDFSGRVIERTGEAMENAGESLERTGAGMQTDPDDTDPQP